jgi:hypothetical protein
MSQYDVQAGPTVESDLTRLWQNAADRRAVADAANAIDRELGVNPSTKGIPSVFGFRQLTIAPLVAEFTVDDALRIVTIWSIRHVGTVTNGR